MKIELELEQSEFNTIIAALRHWESEVIKVEDGGSWDVIDKYEDILLDGLDHLNPDFAFLSSNEIEHLIEFINCE